MKYVIDLKKDGSVRARLVRNSQAEAIEVADEWSGRCEGNAADVQRAEQLWYAVYFGGNLDSVVSDTRFDEMKAAGWFKQDGWEWTLAWDGKFYETLHEAVYAFLMEG